MNEAVLGSENQRLLVSHFVLTHGRWLTSKIASLLVCDLMYDRNGRTLTSAEFSSCKA
jgi:hypothetical protein